MKKYFRRLNKKQRTFFFSTIGVFLIFGIFLTFPVFYKLNYKSFKEEEKQVEVPKLKIIDLNSKSRPIAVMINNIGVARDYHSGLQDAYLVYEMIVEGGLTRLMAIFKDATT